MSDVRRLGDILQRRVAHLEETDQARAYRVWLEVAGDQVRQVTWPTRLTGDTLLIECESSVWAQELTYLGPELLRHLRAADPGTPVERLRFVCRGGRP